MLEKGRLYSLTKDGTKDAVYLNVKHKRFLFGCSEHSTIRIYIEGIFPKHCVLTFENQGKAYLQPLHPSALTLVNGIKIKHKTCLEDDDVITVSIKKFQFTYPPNNSSSNVYIEKLLAVRNSKQKPARKIEIYSNEKNWEISQMFSKCKASNIKYNQKKLIWMIEYDICWKILEFLLKSEHNESLKTSSDDFNTQKTDNSYFVQPLMKYKNKYVEVSSESRKNLALKLYEFFNFIRGLLNKKEDYIFNLLPVLESISKYSIARASKDVLFLPLKSLYLKFLNGREKSFCEKTLQSRISSHSPKNLSPKLETILKEKNQYSKQKQNHHSNPKSSVSYKKRVSLAVKRYHLRKRKTIFMAKSSEIENCENVQLSDEKQYMKEKDVETNSEELGAVTNIEEFKNTRTKKKRGYYKKAIEEFEDKREIKIKQEASMKTVENTIEKENIALEPVKKRQGNKKKATKKTDLKHEASMKTVKNAIEKENIALEPAKKKQGNKTTAAKKTDLSTSTQNCKTKEVLQCQRITRSMAKNVS